MLVIGILMLLIVVTACNRNQVHIESRTGKSSAADLISSTNSPPSPVNATSTSTKAITEETTTLPPSDTPSPSPTNTLQPTNTITPTHSPTPSSTPTEELMIDDGRVWTSGDFFYFIGNVGGRILHDPDYPEDDPVINILLPSARDCVGDDAACDAWIWNAYEVSIPPATWCRWAFKNASLGYGGKLKLGGAVVTLIPVDEIIKTFSAAIGVEGREPYCPEFSSQ